MILFDASQEGTSFEYFSCDLNSVNHPHLVELELEHEAGWLPRTKSYLNGDVRDWLDEQCPGWTEHDYGQSTELCLCNHAHVMAFLLRWS